MPESIYKLFPPARTTQDCIDDDDDDQDNLLLLLVLLVLSFYRPRLLHYTGLLPLVAPLCVLAHSTHAAAPTTHISGPFFTPSILLGK